MIIHVELSHEAEARLIAEALAEGMAVEKLAEQLLDEALAERSASRGRLSADELDREIGARTDLPSGRSSDGPFNEGRSPFGRWRP